MSHLHDRAIILHAADMPEIERGAGIRTRPLVGKWNAAASQLTTGTTTFLNGTMIAPHTHNVEETVLILEGEASVHVGGERTDLVAGDVTWIPGNVPHYFANRGDTPMRIYWVYGSREVTRTLIETGETFPHLSDRDLQVGRSGG